MRAWSVWGVGVTAYLIAVFHRSSLGVTGIEAAERFDVSPGLLAVLSLVQLAVYAAMQVPAGLLLDRFGSTRLIAAGGLFMTVGQLIFAVATDAPTAIVARILIGLGDAVTFISVLRLVVLWFPTRQVPLVTQLTGLLGQLGAVISAVPLIAVLDAYGWTPTFAGAAVVTAVVVVLVALTMRDSPYPRTVRPRPGLAGVRTTLRAAWAEPGTRLGFWSHFVTQFPSVTFTLLWGYPFLVRGEGLAPGTAGVLLTLLVLGSMLSGPILGWLTARHPFHRSGLVLVIVGISVVAWTVVLAWPGRVPLPVLVLLMLAMAPNAPGSLIGFDFARTLNPPERVGTSSGVVNVGGFTATLILVVLIGLVLELLTGRSGIEGSEAYRWAFATQYPVWLLGMVQVLRWRRRIRRSLAERDPDGFAAFKAGPTRHTT
ncbi:MAG: MFS transporter [Geodermatophilaceae bacterium]|nr:MFS transporter [Geodermatophilaceae bacterium]